MRVVPSVGRLAEVVVPVDSVLEPLDADSVLLQQSLGLAAEWCYSKEYKTGEGLAPLFLDGGLQVEESLGVLSQVAGFS